MRKFSLLCAAGLVLSFFTTVQAQDRSSDVAGFYKGKTVQLLVGFSAGGGYDAYARTLARHIERHIPGNPTVVVKNVPGAGSLVLTSQLAQSLPNDGTVFATVARGAAFEPLFGNERARFKPAELNWLGSLNNEVAVCAAWHTSDIKKWEDLRSSALVLGGAGAGSDTEIFPRVLTEALGFKFNIVSGYPGSNELNLGMERSEVQGHCGWSWSSLKTTKADWLRDKKINLLFQMSLTAHPDLPDVPLVMDFAENKTQAQVLQLLFARQAMGRPLVAPPGVPEARLNALRRAVEATVRDPAFIEDARKQNMEVTFVSGEEIQEIVKESYQAPPEALEVIQTAL